MLTKEQIRARYFYCHSGCKAVNKNSGKALEIIGVSNAFISTYEPPYPFTESESDEREWSFDETSILLRPLSAITDEDKKNLIEALGYGREVDVKIKKYIIELSHNEWSDGLDINFLSYPAVDYLRSRGYHTGSFMGYDPIQEGWAIVDDKNVQP